jgi:hypothetical protein
LVVLADGTNNNFTGRRDDTNVVKLAELLTADRRGADDRRVFYDPGVGNPGELPGATFVDQVKRRLDRISGLAFGRGVYENIADCYRFLMQHRRAGDDLYLLGFSRGAFTVRSVAGLVNRFGILRPEHDNLVPTLLHLYFSDPRRVRSRLANDAISRQLEGFAAQPGSKRVHFVGVWDTVAAVGLWPFGLRMVSRPDLSNKHFVHVRQALALDEHRLQFQPRLYAQSNGAVLLKDDTPGQPTGSVEQRWFAGAHCDVGGGYTVAHSGLSDPALAWLVAEAIGKGLRLRLANSGDVDGKAIGPEDVLAALDPPSASPEFDPWKKPGQLAVASELCTTPAWALTGMAVRDTTQWRSDDGRERVPVATSEAARPVGLRSAWVAARPPEPLWLLALTLPVWMLVMGRLLVGIPQPGHLLDEIAWLLAADNRAAAFAALHEYFVVWQLEGWRSLDWAQAAARFDSPRWALVADLGFIVCYALVLSWWVAWAFGRLAGLRRRGDGARPWLNLLGRSLLGLVAFDFAENLFGWLAWTLGPAGWLTLAGGAQCLVAVACAGKLLCLAAVGVLIVWGALTRQPSIDQAPPAATS